MGRRGSGSTATPVGARLRAEAKARAPIADRHPEAGLSCTGFPVPGARCHSFRRKKSTSA